MQRKNSILASILLLAIPVSLSSCVSKEAVRLRPAIGSVFAGPQAGLTPEEQANRDRNCFRGCPALSPSAGYGPTRLIYRGGYVLEHSAVDKIPLWVAEMVAVDQLDGKLQRSNKFLPDPLLKPPYRAELTDYSRSGYDRGHQAPAGNQTKDAKLKDETFYLSNMAPQIPLMNRQIWQQLETLTREWVKRYGAAYEITGPIFYHPKEDDPATADGTLPVKSIGKNHVAVPTHFYKIVIVKDGSQYKSIAFVLENKKYSPPFHFEQFIQSISWIERRTGIDFMPQLNAAERQQLEKNRSAMWPQ